MTAIRQRRLLKAANRARMTWWRGISRIHLGTPCYLTPEPYWPARDEIRAWPSAVAGVEKDGVKYYASEIGLTHRYYHADGRHTYPNPFARNQNG